MRAVMSRILYAVLVYAMAGASLPLAAAPLGCAATLMRGLGGKLTARALSDRLISTADVENMISAPALTHPLADKSPNPDNVALNTAFERVLPTLTTDQIEIERESLKTLIGAAHTAQAQTIAAKKKTGRVVAPHIAAEYRVPGNTEILTQLHRT